MGAYKVLKSVRHKQDFNDIQCPVINSVNLLPCDVWLHGCGFGFCRARLNVATQPVQSLLSLTLPWDPTSLPYPLISTPKVKQTNINS